MATKYLTIGTDPEKRWLLQEDVDLAEVTDMLTGAGSQATGDWAAVRVLTHNRNPGILHVYRPALVAFAVVEEPRYQEPRFREPTS